jgi:hypothetical protein
MRGPRRKCVVPLSAIWPQGALNVPSYQTPFVFKAYNNGSYPIAGAYGDEFGKTRGAWLGASGSRHPVVWLPRIDPSVATQTLVGEDAGLYCRIVSPPQYSDEYGQEEGGAYSHAWQGDVWTFEEER